MNKGFDPIKAKKRMESIQKMIGDFRPVDGVLYRKSPTTGLMRAIKPKPRRGGA